MRVQPAIANITGRMWSGDILEIDGNGSLTGPAYATKEAYLYGSSFTSSSTVQSATKDVAISGTATGPVIAQGNIDAFGTITGTATARGSINTCSHVTGTCTPNAASVPTLPARNAPTFTWSTSNYSNEQVWSRSGFSSWVGSNASAISGIHYVSRGLSLNGNLTITGTTVFVIKGNITFNGSITVNAGSSLLVVTRSGGSITTNQSVSGSSTGSIGFIGGSVRLQGSNNAFSGFVSGSDVTIGGNSLSLTYRSISDPGLS
jgi:hypothetical protein